MTGRSHYEVLGVTREASEVEMRAAYRKRLLELHPDKRSGDSSGVAELELIRVALHTLTDKALRAAYDAERARCEDATAGVVICDTVSLEDFTHVQDGTLTLACRCGGVFMMEASEASVVDVVPCDTCSLAVRVSAFDET